MSYKISEIANILGVTVHTLHYYDKEGLLPFIKRDKNGNRIFEEKDLHYLHVISFLRKADMPLKQIKKYIELYMQGDDTLVQRSEIIKNHRKNIEFKIHELSNILEAVDYKSWYYETAIKAGTAKIFDNMSEKDIPDDMKKIIKNISHIECVNEFLK